ncbi:MAG: OmpA family protein [Cocleimonas sp.]
MKKSTHILSILLTLIAIALWSVGSWWYYACRIKNTCESKTPLIISKQDNPEKASPIVPLSMPDVSSTSTIKSGGNNTITNKSLPKDTDGDGLSDKEELALKTDPNNTDSDGDTIPDNQEVGTNLKQPLDSDSDGTIDALDDDDDNDGLATRLEVKIGTSPLVADTDDDGINDIEELGKNALQPLDTDSDGIIDALDTDDDADGIETINEILLGINPLLADSDSDGISDLQEIGDLLDKPLDTDKDGIIDALDTEEILDHDGDGLTDLIEKELHSDPKNVDSDDDGINDNEELGDNVEKPLDTDGDGIINILDPDDDNDNLDTRFESEIGTNPLSTDTDGDGLDDAKEVAGGSINDLQDTDKDGKIDAVDSDDDNDGIATLLEIKNGTNPLVKNAKNIVATTSPSSTKTLVPTTINKPEISDLKTPIETVSDKVLTLQLLGENSSKSFQTSHIYWLNTAEQPTLDKETFAYLSKVTQWLKKSKRNIINLVGHTDASDSAQENLAMGIKQVMFIREHLIEQGAPFQQIDVASRGATQPIADSSSKEGKLKNSRVEISPLDL